MKKEKIIITLLTIALIACLVGGYFIYDNLNQKNKDLSTKINELEEKIKSTTSENLKENTSKEPSAKTYQDYLNNLMSNAKDETLWENYDSSIKISLSKTGTLTYKAPFLKNGSSNVDTKVAYAKQVTKGADICDGDSWVVYITASGTISALSIDSLEWGEKVKTINLPTLKEITEIYSVQNNVQSETADGTKLYDIYAKTFSGETIKINDLLK